MRLRTQLPILFALIFALAVPTASASEWRETNGQFTGVIAEYEMDEAANFQIRFPGTEWINIRPDLDHADGHVEERHSYLVNTNLTNKYQYRMDGVKNVKLTFINAKGATNEIKSLTAGFELSPLVDVISRSKWGAVESYNYVNGKKEDKADGDKEDIEEEDDGIARVVERDNGQDLLWPYQYADDIKMMVVHHTAGTKGLDNPKQAIRNIHYYHAKTRGWGDIGYNYVIDQQGRIYEGRAGGETVIAGHSLPVNKVSIGVAVLGNYQTQDLPKPVVESLVHLLGAKAELYDLDVTEDVRYKSKNYPVLGGHRDNSSTACPGTHLYNAMPLIRHMASGAQIYKDASFLSSLRHSYKDLDPLRDIIEIDPQESDSVTVKLQNSGKNSWSSSYLAVTDENFYDKAIYFDGTSTRDYTRVSNSVSSIGKGSTGTYRVKLEAGLKSGFHSVVLNGVLNGDKKKTLPVYLPVYVAKPDLSFSVAGKTNYTMKLDGGKSQSASFSIKNKGDVIWNLKDDDVELLAAGSSIVSNLKLEGGQVKPGQSIDGSFTIKAPKSDGVYKATVMPTIDGIGDLDGKGFSIQVTVGDGKKKTTRKSRKLELDVTLDGTVGVKETHQIELYNDSNLTWNKNTFKISKLGKGVGSVSLLEKKVLPGGVGTIVIDINPWKLNAKYQLRFYANKKRVYSKPMKITVGEGSSGGSSFVPVAKAAPSTPSVAPSASGDLGPDIRIHISSLDQKSTGVDFDGDLYVDSKKMPVTGDVYVKALASSVRVNVGGKNYVGKVIRFVNSDFVTLTDYENRPTWNTALNDNQFRGVMEFRSNGSLIAINELPMEHYLWGIAEVSNGTPTETIKTILVAARSYGYHYVTDGTKFPGKPYDLDDSPARSQKYLGYGYEKRAPNVVNAIKATNGIVVTYDGSPIKVPYFTQSDGRTRSAQEVWGWTNTPYLQSVTDSYCDETVLYGHGVGISGCGVEGMANAGFGYEDIVKFFLQGVEFKVVY